MSEDWLGLERLMTNPNNAQHCREFSKLKKVREHLQASPQYPTFLHRFHELLDDFTQMVKISPEQARLMQLSSSRVTNTSVYAFQWRIQSLMASLGETGEVATEGETRWQQQRHEQIEQFMSGVSDTFLLLNALKTVEERSAFLRKLKEEMETAGKYTTDQLEVMEKAYAALTNKLEDDDWSEIAPTWFIPWYELVVDEWSKLGEGGFGSVHRAKGVDSDVVVKRVILPGSDSPSDDTLTTYSSFYASEDPSATQVQEDTAKRAEARAMFRREVDIWFGFSHPHVVRLFGACHVGRPFFVCEYATNGTLVSYLGKNPDELWAKLHEAALGVQYLHARGVVHGDLKGNNIVVGIDMKAKVTDFGLSSVMDSEDKTLVTGAWNWVAPELLDTNQSPNLASDVYSLGMCIVEALRVVEAVQSGKASRHCLPWTVADRAAMKYHATRGKLPGRPSICEDSQWELVERMCVLDPASRIKISTVVDELAKLTSCATTTSANGLAGTSCSNTVEWELVVEVIDTARMPLADFQDDVAQPDAVVPLYGSLWERLGQVQQRIDGQHSDACRAAFSSLVADADTSTKKLRDRKRSIISLAETTMRCYALDRALTKFCEAHFIE